MNAKKILALALAALMLLSLAACGQSADPTATEAPAEPTEAPVEATEAPAEDTSVTVTDMTGREITLEEPATRIVALTASDCEIICALGGMDLLVGRGTYCDYPAEVQEIPSVQSGYETNIEQIIALEPQVLLMSTMAQTEEQIKALEDAGVHVVVSDAQDIEGTYAAIRMIGALLGKNEEAETVIDGMKTTFESLKGVCGDGEKTIYFEVSPLEYGLWTAGANTFMNEIAELLGLKNCFADVEGWAEISEEQVLEAQPRLYYDHFHVLRRGPHARRGDRFPRRLGKCDGCEERRHPQSAEQRAFPPRTASGGRRADARRLHCRR